MGESGSGKTSLLSSIGLLDSFCSGSYLVDNTDAVNLSSRQKDDLRSTVFGFIFQDFHLIPHLSVVENVAVPLRHRRRISARMRKASALEILDLLGIADLASAAPRALSGGERQRVTIARALVAEPKVILADEPTGSLDVDTRDEVMELLLSCVRVKRASLLVVTHDAQIAAATDARIDISELGDVDADEACHFCGTT